MGKTHTTFIRTLGRERLKYILLRVARRQVPATLFFTLMRLGAFGLAGNSSESAPGETFESWHRLLRKNAVNIEGKHVLEVGSGRCARMALHILAAGASRVTLIDLFAAPLVEPKHQAILRSDCAKLGLGFEDVLTRVSVVAGDIVSLPLPQSDGQADLVFSLSVLEHVGAPQLVLSKCWGWTRPGGVTCHVIDLRDHFFRYPFEMLTFSDSVWERWLNPRGGFELNRWRAPDWVRAMEDAGFTQLECDVIMRDTGGLG